MKRAAAIALSLLCCELAHAGVVTEEGEGFRATVYAPDWVWKGQNLNFLVVLENISEHAISPTLSMAVSNADVDEFVPESTGSVLGELAPGENRRAAFANVATGRATIGKQYNFVFSVNDSTGATTPLSMNADVKVIRGAVVSGGRWAAFLPAFVAAAWCWVLALYFRRYAAAGAWKTPSAPVWDSR